MRVALTGAEGRIGRVLAKALNDSASLVLLDRAEGCNLSGLGAFDAVIHLAVNFTDAVDSIGMLDDVLLTSETGHLIYASSITVDPHSGVTDSPDYVQAKAVGEGRCAQWVEAHGDRKAIALRLGHFDPASHPPHEHEAVRVTESGLIYWFNRALSSEPATGQLTIWTATGNGGARNLAHLRPD